MKKVLAILIALLFSFSLVAFAQETAPTGMGTSKVEQKSESVKTKKPAKKTKKAKTTKKTKKTKKTKQESQQ